MTAQSGRPVLFDGRRWTRTRVAGVSRRGRPRRYAPPPAGHPRADSGVPPGTQYNRPGSARQRTPPSHAVRNVQVDGELVAASRRRSRVDGTRSPTPPDSSATPSTRLGHRPPGIGSSPGSLRAMTGYPALCHGQQRVAGHDVVLGNAAHERSHRAQHPESAGAVTAASRSSNEPRYARCGEAGLDAGALRHLAAPRQPACSPALRARQETALAPVAAFLFGRLA